MKKTVLLILVALFVAGVGAYAQKSYVTVFCPQNDSEYNTIFLSGDVPQSMQTEYTTHDFTGTWYGQGYKFIGNVLNILASNGFSVEQMNTVFDNSSSNYHRVVTIYLLSKPAEGSIPDSTPQVPKAVDNGKIHEVARYNLQGMPVDKEEKGIQIVVYSNYTTKTIIKE